jgi:hypothetical protein
MGPAATLSSSYDLPPFTPRSTARLAQLAHPGSVGAEVDLRGLLVWAGEVNTGGWGVYNGVC